MQTLDKQAGGSWLIGISEGTKINCKVVVIAGGLGCFKPRKPEVSRIVDFENKGVHYTVRNPEVFRKLRVKLNLCISEIPLGGIQT